MITYTIITPDLYAEYNQLVQQNSTGNMMLPFDYQQDIWGIVALQEGKIVTGLVGRLRGNKPIVGYWTKSLYVDAYPVFAGTGVAPQDFMHALQQEAKRAGIVMIRFTHWVRGEVTLPLHNPQPNATFVIDLTQSMEEIANRFSKTKKQYYRKGNPFHLRACFYTGEDAVVHIPELQALRAATQTRAIGKNAQSSMLLKSNAFFANLLRTTNTTLCIVYQEDRPVVASTFVTGGKTAYYHMSGSDITADRQTESSTFSLIETMRYFQQQGVQYFDFGGAPYLPDETNPAYGVYLYKKRFGGDYLINQTGDIIICRWRYKLLNAILNNRTLLRFLSKRGM